MQRAISKSIDIDMFVHLLTLKTDSTFVPYFTINDSVRALPPN